MYMYIQFLFTCNCTYKIRYLYERVQRLARTEVHVVSGFFFYKRRDNQIVRSSRLDHTKKIPRKINLL